jgi:hypothetical protein
MDARCFVGYTPSQEREMKLARKRQRTRKQIARDQAIAVRKSGGGGGDFLERFPEAARIPSDPGGLAW